MLAGNSNNSTPAALQDDLSPILVSSLVGRLGALAIAVDKTGFLIVVLAAAGILLSG